MYFNIGDLNMYLFVAVLMKVIENHHFLKILFIIGNISLWMFRFFVGRHYLCTYVNIILCGFPIW